MAYIQHTKEEPPRTLSDDQPWSWYHLHPTVQIATAEFFDPIVPGIIPSNHAILDSSGINSIIKLQGSKQYQLWVCALARKHHHGFLAARILKLTEEWQEVFITPWQASNKFTSYRFNIDFPTALNVLANQTPPASPVYYGQTRSRSNSQVSNSSITSESQQSAELLSKDVKRKPPNVVFGTSPADLCASVTEAVEQGQVVTKIQLLYKASLIDEEFVLLDIPCHDFIGVPRVARKKRAMSQPTLLNRFDSTSTLLIDSPPMLPIDRKGSIMSELAGQFYQASLQRSFTVSSESTAYTETTPRPKRFADDSCPQPKRKLTGMQSFLEQQRMEKEDLAKLEAELEKARRVWETKNKDHATTKERVRSATTPMCFAPSLFPAIQAFTNETPEYLDDYVAFEK